MDRGLRAPHQASETNTSPGESRRPRRPVDGNRGLRAPHQASESRWKRFNLISLVAQASCLGQSRDTARRIGPGMSCLTGHGFPLQASLNCPGVSHATIGILPGQGNLIRMVLPFYWLLLIMWLDPVVERRERRKVSAMCYVA